jgi:hypothetical protein
VEVECLIGIGAVILDGIPARKVRDISETEAMELMEHAGRYTRLALVHANKGTDLGFTEKIH